MATGEVTSARGLVWRRRRRTFEAHWATFRGNGQGIVGLAALSLIVAMALVSPLLVPAAQLDPATADGPILAGPSVSYPLGTDNFGRPVLGL
ncbi:MAG TPA: ABC transporter permease, partial [Actinomycetota bacterium]|nr:ABC transporter permease [Actinomycetota bacterium]